MKYLRRIVWYLASRLTLICLIAGLTVTVFYYAMNYTNIQIVLKDGMATRAKVIMGIDEDDGKLSKYFQSGYLQNDTLLSSALQGNTPYADYNVRGIDHRLSLGFFWAWPWDNTARVTVTEQIPRIDGRAKGTRADALITANGPDALYPPAWKEARYRAILIKENGQWKIRSLTPQ